jgi:hypothetical protein
MNDSPYLALQAVDLDRESPAVRDESTCDLPPHGEQGGKFRTQTIEPAAAAQGPGRDIVAQSQVMKMPTQPVLRTSALPDQVITMFKQQPKILLCPVGSGTFFTLFSFPSSE